VSPPENPLELGTLYVSNPLQRKEKVHPGLFSSGKLRQGVEAFPKAPIIIPRQPPAAHCVQASTTPPGVAPAFRREEEREDGEMNSPLQRRKEPASISGF